MKAMILKAIKNGNHQPSEIVRIIKAELKYGEFCKAIAELQVAGKIVSNRGYYLA